MLHAAEGAQSLVSSHRSKGAVRLLLNVFGWEALADASCVPTNSIQSTRGGLMGPDGLLVLISIVRSPAAPCLQHCMQVPSHRSWLPLPLRRPQQQTRLTCSTMAWLLMLLRLAMKPTCEDKQALAVSMPSGAPGAAAALLAHGSATHSAGVALLQDGLQVGHDRGSTSNCGILRGAELLHSLHSNGHSPHGRRHTATRMVPALLGWPAGAGRLGLSCTGSRYLQVAARDCCSACLTSRPHVQVT